MHAQNNRAGLEQIFELKYSDGSGFGDVWVESKLELFTTEEGKSFVRMRNFDLTVISANSLEQRNWWRKAFRFDVEVKGKMGEHYILNISAPSSDVRTDWLNSIQQGNDMKQTDCQL